MKTPVTYTYDEVHKATLEYFGGDELATDAWISKYAVQNEVGQFLEETPYDMHTRMAKEFARIERKFENNNPLARRKLSRYGKSREPLTEVKIAKLFDDFKYIVPQGSVMSLLGHPFKTGSLSNCVVLEEMHDSYGSINYVDGALQALMKRRCGVGVNLSKLRPAGSSVSNSAGSSTGAISFMERFSNTTREVAQCIEGSQVIKTKRGVLPIKDVLTGDEVYGQFGWNRVNKILKNKKQVFRLTTKRGYEITTSKDHIFTYPEFGVVKERKLSDFNIGDLVLLLPGKFESDGEYVRLNHFEYQRKGVAGNSSRLKEDVILPEVLNESLAYLLGFSYGGGSVEYDKFGEPFAFTLAIENKRPQLLEKLKLIIDEVFGSNIHTLRDGCGACKRLTINRKIICKFLADNQILKQKSENLEFPEAVKKSKHSVQAAFLAGYFDADGYASGKKRGFVFNSVSVDMLKNVQQILMSMGVISAIRCENREKLGWRNIYTLSVVGAKSKGLLLEILSFSEKLKTHVAGVRDSVKTPFTAKAKGIKCGKVSFLNRNELISYNSHFKLRELRKIEDNPLVIDEVSTIELVGDLDTFDLCLDSENLFYCQGFYVHNSGRRGALMELLDVSHPDIFDFVKIKRDLTKVTGANISLDLSDEFMEAVKADSEFTLRWPCDVPIEQAKVTKVIKAKDLYEEIIKSAHECAEPGLVFRDLQHWYSTSSVYPRWKNVAPNPCAEIVMNNDSCRLIAMNMFGFVELPFLPEAKFNKKKWFEYCYEAQRLSDNLVELELEAVKRILKKIESDPEPEHIKAIETRVWQQLYKNGKEGRRTGTGFTGLADMLAAVNLRYDSDEAIKFVSEIMKIKCEAEFESSIDMAIERGKFKDFDPEIDNTSLFVQMLQVELPETYKRMMRYGRRNISISTVAPTGTLSLLTQTSSGIEPVFKLSYKRNKKVMEGESFDFQDALGDKWKSYEVFHHGLALFNKFNPKEIKLVNGLDTQKQTPYYGSTAEEISWQKRVEMQAAVQKYVTHAISATINLPEDVSKEVVAGIYLKAWESKLKGITVYRAGSRSGVLVSDTVKALQEAIAVNHAPKRPKILPANVYFFHNDGEKWVGILGLFEGRPYEIFTGKATALNLIGSVENGQISKRKSGVYDFTYVDGHQKEHTVEGLGSCFDAEFYNYGKFVSAILRHGMPIQYVVELVSKIKFDNEGLHTWKAGVSRILKRFIADGTQASDSKCENCGDPKGVIYQEGCKTCKSCGNSKCG